MLSSVSENPRSHPVFHHIIRAFFSIHLISKAHFPDVVNLFLVKFQQAENEITIQNININFSIWLLLSKTNKQKFREIFEDVYY